jgi:hypothetical protein
VYTSQTAVSDDEHSVRNLETVIGGRIMRLAPSRQGLTIVLGIFLGCILPVRGSIHAQELSVDSALLLVVPTFDGRPEVTPELRARVAGSRATMSLYADLLSGRRRGHQVDTAAVIGWLVESGDPHFLSVFLRFSSPDRSFRYSIFRAAISGLARHAQEPEAATALTRFVRDGAEIHRRNAAIDRLLAANSAATQAILRQADVRQFTPSYQQRIRATLAAPPTAENPPGHGNSAADSSRAP